MLISGSVPNLFNGVSQQTASMRLPSQGEDMDNFIPSITDGLVKRPPTWFIRTMLPTVPNDVSIHIINRDMDNRYILMIMPGDLKVFDMKGNECSVRFPNGKSYLQYAGNNKPDLAACTIADYTFILNRARTVAAGTERSPKSSGSLINVKQASYDTTYELVVNGSSSSLQTPKNIGDTNNPPPTVSTKNIANSLGGTGIFNKINGVEFTVSVKDSSIFIKPKYDVGYSCSVSDSRGDTHITAINGTVQQFAKLPAVAPDGYVVEITGDEGSSFDNYYVRFAADTKGAFGQGVWVETVKPDTPLGVDESTMPHALVMTSPGAFEFKPVAWDKRAFGDEDSAPDPAFVGRRIQDMFLYRNRLGFLSDDNLTLSAAADFFRLYPETVTTVVASDPISIAAGFESVTNLKHAVAFDEDLLLFSEQAQFILEAPDVFSSETAALKVATTYSADTRTKPVNSGRTVFFITPGTTNASVMEYYIDASNGSKGAMNVSAHIPRYLPSDIKRITASRAQDVFILVPAGGGNKLYMYKYHWSGGEKLQASWSTLTIPYGGIVDACFLDAKLYLFVQRGGLSLESIDFSQLHTNMASSSDGLIIPHLDRFCVMSSGTYSPAADRTTWTLPYDRRGQPVTMLDQHSFTELKISHDSETVVSADGDYRYRGFLCGAKYPAHYTFSEQFLRRDEGNGRISTQQGRLQYRRWTLVHGRSGYFEVSVEHEDGRIYTYPLNGMILGLLRNTLNKMELTNGVFRFPVKSKSDRVKITVSNDTYMPCSLLSAEWEADFTTRVRGI